MTFDNPMATLDDKNLKFCKDCVYSQNQIKIIPNPLCTAPGSLKYMDLVTGQGIYTNCKDARTEYAFCGKEGKAFVAKKEDLPEVADTTWGFFKQLVGRKRNDRI